MRTTILFSCGKSLLPLVLLFLLGCPASYEQVTNEYTVYDEETEEFEPEFKRVIKVSKAPAVDKQKWPTIAVENNRLAVSYPDKCTVVEQVKTGVYVDYEERGGWPATMSLFSSCFPSTWRPPLSLAAATSVIGYSCRCKRCLHPRGNASREKLWGCCRNKLHHWQ